MKLLAIALSLSAAAATPAAVDTFQVGTVTLTLPVPAGFCKPATPETLAAAQMQSAADEANVTLSTLFSCEGGPRNPDYFLVKAPKTALLQSVDRPTLLAELAKAMALPQFTSPDASATNDPIEKQLEKIVGIRPDIEGAIKPLGRDDVCVYMGGVLTLSAGEIHYKRTVSVCITAVSNKVLAVYRYSDGSQAGNVARHLATARAAALTMTPVAP